jgi:hypothetical protein
MGDEEMQTTYQGECTKSEIRRPGLLWSCYVPRLLCNEVLQEFAQGIIPILDQPHCHEPVVSDP